MHNGNHTCRYHFGARKRTRDIKKMFVNIWAFPELCSISWTGPGWGLIQYVVGKNHRSIEILSWIAMADPGCCNQRFRQIHIKWKCPGEDWKTDRRLLISEDDQLTLHYQMKIHSALLRDPGIIEKKLSSLWSRNKSQLVIDDKILSDPWQVLNMNSKKYGIPLQV